ncbi:alanine racemase [Cognatishimia maritima]|uniref:D-serine deaminase, pyridoxal phosphate-dependent n=1 Tax=Cognatishimia maritima TaxID=870908 RepID=A0A1M5LCK1_9RHOB|nr:alanine racemase [Cognatishimia maritima]SHG62690.1 D-serine deaminase, pyridoxal phosphate-dependent [Cognatishimia maritima]
MSRPHPNSHLIGDLQARSALATPALILDLPVLEANLSTGMRLVKDAGKAFRPHFKAHKSLDIARRQLELGATGICVATLSEAEAACELGAELLLTSIISTDAQCKRIAALAASGATIIAVVDHPDVALRLESVLQGTCGALDVLIDLDMRRARSGCATPKAAAELGNLVSASPTLRLRGVQAYAGQLSHMTSCKERSAAHAEFTSRLAAFKFALSHILPDDPIVSGGSTGSMNLDLSGPLTELQCGSYALMDVEYLNVEPGWTAWPFKPALRVQSSVLSTHWDAHAITDAGDKWFADKYGAAPRIVLGAPETAVFEPISDEHARLVTEAKLHPGDRIECLPPHCDPTINLFAAYHVFAGEQLRDIWPIEARGL